MDAPPIQYARTEDGVNIAYWTLGEGEPLVLATRFLSSLEAEWDVPEWCDLFEALVSFRRVIRFDPRGVGLSALPEPTAEDFNPERLALDIEAVIDRVSATPVALLGDLHGGYGAIQYAATHPDRVTHLVLWEAFARGKDFYNIPRVGTIAAIRHVDEGIWLETLMRLVAGLADPNAARALTRLMQASVSEGVWELITNAAEAVDVTASLPGVQAPTLILRRRESHFGSAKLARDLAAGIPDARMMALEGDASWLPAGDRDALVAVLRNFIGPKIDDVLELSDSGAFRTILFTDLESSTALTQAVGDAKAQDVLHGHNDVVRAALAEHQGEEVKHTGDGIMASFGSAVSAVEAALAIQRDLASGEIRVCVGTARISGRRWENTRNSTKHSMTRRKRGKRVRHRSIRFVPIRSPMSLLKTVTS